MPVCKLTGRWFAGWDNAGLESACLDGELNWQATS